MLNLWPTLIPGTSGLGVYTVAGVEVRIPCLSQLEIRIATRSGGGGGNSPTVIGRAVVVDIS